MDGDRRIIENGAIAVEGDRIVELGDSQSVKKKHSGSDVVIDASKHMITPGFVNGHTHLESAYDKCMMDDVPVVPWCERYFSWTYANLTPENYYYSVLKNLLRMVKTGTVSVFDCGTINNREDSAARAVTDIGARAVFGRNLMTYTRRRSPCMCPMTRSQISRRGS